MSLTRSQVEGIAHLARLEITEAQMPVYVDSLSRIIDFVDAGHPALLRMWDKRQRGYRAMGYRMGADDALA